MKGLEIGLWIVDVLLVLWLSGREKERGLHRILRILLGILGTPIALVLFLYSRRRINPILCFVIPWGLFSFLSAATVFCTAGLDDSLMERRMCELDPSQARGDYAVSYDEVHYTYSGKYIPDKWMTWSPEDVGYILRYTSKTTSARYTGGVTANGEELKVTLVDADTGEIIGSTVFETDFPYFIDGYHHLRVFESEVESWVLQLLPDPPEGARVSPETKASMLIDDSLLIGKSLLACILLLILGPERRRERVPVSQTKDLRIRGQVDLRLLPQLVYKDPAQVLQGLRQEKGAFIAGIYNDIFAQMEKLSGEKLPRYTENQLHCYDRGNIMYILLPKGETASDRWAEAIALVVGRDRVLYFVMERNPRGALRIGHVDKDGGYKDLAAAERKRSGWDLQLWKLTEDLLRQEAVRLAEEKARRSAKYWGEEW